MDIQRVERVPLQKKFLLFWATAILIPGAMYRAVTLYFLDHHVALTNPKEITRALQQIQIAFKVNSRNNTETYLNGLNVEKEIRTMRVSERVSQVSTMKDVRKPW